MAARQAQNVPQTQTYVGVVRIANARNNSRAEGHDLLAYSTIGQPNMLGRFAFTNYRFALFVRVGTVAASAAVGLRMPGMTKLRSVARLSMRASC
jgi:hypothetical protein